MTRSWPPGPTETESASTSCLIPSFSSTTINMPGSSRGFPQMGGLSVADPAIVGLPGAGRNFLAGQQAGRLAPLQLGPGGEPDAALAVRGDRRRPEHGVPKLALSQPPGLISHVTARDVGQPV